MQLLQSIIINSELRTHIRPFTARSLVEVSFSISQYKVSQMMMENTKIILIGLGSIFALWMDLRHKLPYSAQIIPLSISPYFFRGSLMKIPVIKKSLQYRNKCKTSRYKLTIIE